MPHVDIVHADMRAALAEMATNGVRFDGVVTDPPYHLASIVRRFGGASAAPAISNGATGIYERASRGFMGRQWDGGDVAFRADTWALVGSVMKPGAHLVAFGAPKNAHRLTCAIEDAGFEIRDDVTDLLASDALVRSFVESLTEEQAAAFLRVIEESPLGGALGRLFWMFGTGFPKSHDVSKAIDKRRDWTALPKLQSAIRSARKALAISQSEAARRSGVIAAGEVLGGGGYMWFETGLRVPTGEQWPRIRDALRMGAEFDSCFAEAEREVTGTVEEWKNRSNYALTSKDGLRRDKPASEAAMKWAGWGTALKPAYEPIILARWPLDGSIAANVLAHGVGGLNIDACRVEWVGTEDAAAAAGFAESRARGTTKQSASIGKESRDGTNRYDPSAIKGRWPANVVYDGSDEVVAAFPRAPGQRAPVTGNEGNSRNVFNPFAANAPCQPRGDEGSAARFFYSAKADTGDRLGSKHPTVKPVDPMRWLVRLIVPKGGRVLDPFAGSGTTGMAALAEGCNATLIEREAEYVADIRRRIAHVSGGDAPLFAAAE